MRGDFLLVTLQRPDPDNTVDGESWTTLRFLVPRVQVSGTLGIKHYDGVVKRKELQLFILPRSEHILSFVACYYSILRFAWAAHPASRGNGVIMAQPVSKPSDWHAAGHFARACMIENTSSCWYWWRSYQVVVWQVLFSGVTFRGKMHFYSSLFITSYMFWKWNTQEIIYHTA